MIHNKTGERGFSHIILPIVVILSIACIGTYVLAVSHAATPSPISPANGSHPSTGPTATELADAKLILANEMNHGWTKCFTAGPGLAINWNEVKGATKYDWNGTGNPDPCPAAPSVRHEDRLTDVRYLHSLLLYKADTGSTYFNNEINKETTHLFTLFNTSNVDPRGWVYNEFSDMARLTGDSRFSAIANAMVAKYAASPYDSTRPDYQFTEASALVQSGKPAYVSQGRAEIAAYWKANYIAQINLIYQRGEIESASNGDIAVALARAGYTSQANTILNGMMAHLWDRTYTGFYEGANYNNGQLTIKNKKTGGRMMNVLLLGKLLGNSNVINQMNTVFVSHIYQGKPAGYEGVLYEQQYNWQPEKINGVTEDWTTTEADGVSLVAVLQR